MTRLSRRFWQDKCVVVSGASSGIGRALAEELGQVGARLALVARRTELLETLAVSLAAADVPVAFATADVTDAEQIQKAVETLSERLGPIDVAIANAGIYRKTPVVDFDAATAAAVITTNVLGVSNLFAATMPGMIARRRGHLAAVASIAGMLGLPGAAAYSASKAAVMRMCDSLRVDLVDHGVRVTTLCPGFVDTSMLSDLERATRKEMLSAAEAARRIGWAIERARPEYAFPWPTRLEANVARRLPFPVFRLAMKWFGEMEDT